MRCAEAKRLFDLILALPKNEVWYNVLISYAEAVA